MNSIAVVYPLLATLAAYAVGSLSFAVIVSRVMGLNDPRSYGSKNPGATNVLRSGNKAAAALTLLLDGLKGWLPMALVMWFGRDYGMREGTLDFTQYNAGARLPQFFSLDARIDRRWQVGRSQLITYLDVQNATARQNVSAVAWNARLRSPERQTSIGVLPSIGIDWTF